MSGAGWGGVSMSSPRILSRRLEVRRTLAFRTAKARARNSSLSGASSILWPWSQSSTMSWTCPRSPRARASLPTAWRCSSSARWRSNSSPAKSPSRRMESIRIEDAVFYEEDKDGRFRLLLKGLHWVSGPAGGETSANSSSSLTAPRGSRSKGLLVDAGAQAECYLLLALGSGRGGQRAPWPGSSSLLLPFAPMVVGGVSPLFHASGVNTLVVAVGSKQKRP